MLKRLNKARFRCPVVVYDEMNAVILGRKRPKSDKNPKIFHFSKFLRWVSSNF